MDEYHQLIDYGKAVFGFSRDKYFETVDSLLAVARKSVPHRYYEAASTNLAERMARFIDKQQAEKCQN